MPKHAHLHRRAERLAPGESRSRLRAVVQAAVDRQAPPPEPRKVCGQGVTVAEPTVRRSRRRVVPGAPAPLLMRLTPSKHLLDPSRGRRQRIREERPHLEGVERLEPALRVVRAARGSVHPPRPTALSSRAMPPRGPAAARPRLPAPDTAGSGEDR